MRSPVSLCTGVTYDRSSIQHWLDSGNATCPATMQSLPSTDLVPNLTLLRLIRLWSSSKGLISSPDGLLSAVRSDPDPVRHLRRLAGFLSDPEVDDFAKNSVLGAGGCAAALASLLSDESAALVTTEAVIGILALIFTIDRVEEENKQIAADSIASDLVRSLSALIDVLKAGSCVGSRIDAARVLEALLSSISDRESKVLITEKADLILPELILLIGPRAEDRIATDAGVACLAAVASISRRAQVKMAQAKALPALARVLAGNTSASTADRALKLMEAAAGCSEGREAICEDAELCVAAILERVMKAGREGTESAVAVLWGLCHVFRDRRAQEAVAAAAGGVTKILLLMQSDCSPAVRRMGGDLLKMFRVNSKSCLSRYETKTTHIMPF